MRRYCIVLAFLFAFGAMAAEAPPQEPQQSSDRAHERKLADIRKLMAVTGADKMANQMFDQMAATLRANEDSSSTSTRFLEEFRKEFDLNRLMDLQVQAYDKFLSAEDVQAVLAFYESASGQRMVEAMPKIMTEMMTQGLQMSKEITERVMKKMRQQQP